MRTLSLADVDTGGRLLAGETGPTPREPAVVELDDIDWSDPARIDLATDHLRDRAGIVIGRASRPLPDAAGPVLDHLTITLAPAGPGRAWVDPPNGATAALSAIAETVMRSPRASLVLVDVLKAIERSDVATGLLIESLAYSTLLAGPEFSAWRASRPRHPSGDDSDAVLLHRSADPDVLTVTLNRPERHNAFSRAMRDQLLAALGLATEASIEHVLLVGNGPSFCSGGDLDEFGTFGDPATAHLVRLDASVGREVHLLRDRVSVVLHGACVGAGIEIPAFAARVTARSDAWFHLPEVAMGLIPGAGGTVSITRRIGRWRTAWMALSGDRVDTDRALDWGLIDGHA